LVVGWSPTGPTSKFLGMRGFAVVGQTTWQGDFGPGMMPAAPF
jgi:hypothetical protein